LSVTNQLSIANKLKLAKSHSILCITRFQFVSHKTLYWLFLIYFFWGIFASFLLYSRDHRDQTRSYGVYSGNVIRLVSNMSTAAHSVL